MDECIYMHSCIYVRIYLCMYVFSYTRMIYVFIKNFIWSYSHTPHTLPILMVSTVHMSSSTIEMLISSKTWIVIIASSHHHILSPAYGHYMILKYVI